MSDMTGGTAATPAPVPEAEVHVEPAPATNPSWERVQLARHPKRPHATDYMERLFVGFQELHGDRFFGDDKATMGGFAHFEGQPVMVIAQQKGRDTKAKLYRNFGMPKPEGYRKAMRLMRLAEKFNRPVITLIDTAGHIRESTRRSAARRKRSLTTSARCLASRALLSPLLLARAAAVALWPSAWRIAST